MLLAFFITSAFTTILQKQIAKEEIYNLLHLNVNAIPGAIDDVRGRRALRALVGDNRLVELLPRKVYNAITRQEPFYVRGSLNYHRLNSDQMITIQ
mgnify:CR=1 FL=1